MKICSSAKRGILGGLISAVLYFVTKEQSKGSGVHSIAPGGRRAYRCMDITDKNMGELHTGRWIVLIDVKRKPEHLYLARFASRLANFALLYPDTLKKAELAARLRFSSCGQLVVVWKVPGVEIKMVDVLDMYLLGRIMCWREGLRELLGSNVLFATRTAQLVLLLLEKFCICPA
jgi:hypothetical protein